MLRRYELTDEAYGLIEDLLPGANPLGGGQWRPHRQVLNGMFWILHTGAQWREMPGRYGPWKTAYNRFRRWQKEGLLDRILQRLQARLDAEGRIDWDLWCVDGSSIRASRSAAGAGKKGATPSPRTTRWVAQEAGLAPSCTWLLTAEACHWPRRPHRGRPTSPSTSSR